MLKKNKNTALATTSQAQTHIGTIIGPGAIFDGDLIAPETIRIDGSLNGNCECEGNLILGKEGVINGNIEAQNVTLAGNVTGDIEAHGKLELFSTARLTGDITAKSLIIDEDAYYEGRCTMTTGVPVASASIESKE